jgi:hypothetical protein
MNFDTLLSSNKLLSLLNTSSSGSNSSTGGSFSKRRRKTQEEGEEEEKGGSQNLKEVILKRSLNDLVARYQIIYDNVLDDRNLFEFKSTILIRSLDEVKTLIGFL